MTQPYLSITLFLVAVSGSVFATEVYRSEDAQGRITYSDTVSIGSREVKIDNRSYRHLHHVTKVYDGDTVELENGERVRLLGVNTPEVESRLRDNEPGGTAAKEWLTAQVQDKKIYLEFDQEKRDKYKRLLAHLFLPDGSHINRALLENGLAIVNIMPPNLRYTDALVAAQQSAEEQKSGIWSRSEYQPHTLAQITKKHAAGWQRYMGTPESIRPGKKYTRLVFSDRVDVRIANQHLNLFPALKTYVGKPLEIRGWVSRSKGQYSIQIQHPSALVQR